MASGAGRTAVSPDEWLKEFGLQRAQLVSDFEHELTSAAGSLPVEERASWSAKFRGASTQRATALQKDAGFLAPLSLRCETAEYAHAVRSGIQTADESGSEIRRPECRVARSVIHGMALVTSLSSQERRPGMVEAVAAAAHALATPAKLDSDGNQKMAGVALPGADGMLLLDLGTPETAPQLTGQESAAYAVLTRCWSAAGQPHCPLVYLVDLHGGEGRRPEPGLGPERRRGDPESQSTGERPAVGIVINAPAARIAGGRRVLDADALVSFARSSIFHAVYDGTPPSAVATMRAALDLEVVAWLDPLTGVGLWVDVSPSRQRAAAMLLIEAGTVGPWRFFQP